MKFGILLCAVTAILMPTLCWSSEEYDPLLYPDMEEENLSPVSPSASSNDQRLLSFPKVMADEDLNFENMDFDSLEEESASSVTQEASASSAKELKEETLQNSGSMEAKVDKNKSLTDNLEAKSETKEANQDSIVSVPKVEETWLSKIKEPLMGEKSDFASSTTSATQGTTEGKVNLSSLVESSKRTVKRSNASVFDISGAMLRMSFAQIEEALTRRGFRRTMQKMDIPNFIRWRNEDKCRASGVVGYERLENCVIQMAKKDGYQFVERASYSKFKTREEIEVRFTSTFTNNKAYRISYKSEAATNISGNSQKQIYLRNIKVYDFWKKINQKYGTPDNKDDVIWGLGGNKPYLQAGTGRLVLEDPMLRELDYTRMSREDQKFMNTDLYSF